MFKHSKGFTIIELIVVIAIIAILAAIVTVSVTGYIKKSKIAAIQADMKQLSTLGVQYSIDHNGLYNSFCHDSGVGKISAAMQRLNISSNFRFDCRDPAQCLADNKWVAIALDQAFGEVATFYFCVDSQGVTKTENIGQDNYDNCDCR